MNSKMPANVAEFEDRDKKVFRSISTDFQTAFSDPIKRHLQMVNNQEQLNSKHPRFLKQIGKENVIQGINNK